MTNSRFIFRNVISLSRAATTHDAVSLVKDSDCNPQVNTAGYWFMNVTDLTREFITIPSINPTSQIEGQAGTGEAAMANYVEEILRSAGAVTETWEVYPERPNVIGFFDFGAEKTVIFDAHLDTVPIEGMTIDPFAGDVRDGRVYGRGACDVKGPAAAAICALAHVGEQVKNGGHRAKFNVLYAGVCDEESGFGGVKNLVQRLPQIFHQEIAGVVVIEPTGLNPIVAHKGVIRWTIRTSGMAAHSSTPHLGDNAIYRMAPVLSALESFARELQAREPHPQLGPPTLSVGVIQGGSAVNVVPDFCCIQVDRRLIPGETPEGARRELQECLAGLADVGNVHISDSIVEAHAMATDPDSDLVHLALQAAAAAGHTTTVQYASYCTDASFYPSAMGAVIVVGPGSIDQAHTKDEWISIDQLNAGVDLFTRMLL